MPGRAGKKLADRGISGGTVLDSCGMARILTQEENEPLLISSLKEILDLDRQGSKTLFLIAEESQVKTISQTLNEVTGGLEKPDTGILFCTPLVYIEGLRKNPPQKKQPQ